MTTETKSIELATETAQKYLDDSLLKIEKIVQSDALEDYAKDLGLSNIKKELTQERVKLFLSVLGLYSTIRFFKSNFLQIGLLAGTSVILLKNREKIKNLFSKNEYIKSKIAEVQDLDITKIYDYPITLLDNEGLESATDSDIQEIGPIILDEVDLVG